MTMCTARRLSSALQGGFLLDTSPSYLLFQTLLPLFWTLTCMIWMELTRTDAVFSRIAMVLSLCRNKSSRNDLKLHGDYFGNNKKYWRKNQGQGAHTLSTRVGGAPPASWAPWSSTDLNSNSIYSCSGRKKSKRKIHRVIRYGATAKP